MSQHCPCGLFQEQFEIFRDLIVQGKCRAPRLDNEEEFCARALGAHPRRPPAPALPVHPLDLKTPSPKRLTSRQDSFKKKLLKRNRKESREGLCDICDKSSTILEAAHIFELSKSSTLDSLFLSELDKDLPISANDASNGLLLCPTCHSLFDTTIVSKKRKNTHRFLEIDPTGMIHLYGAALTSGDQHLNGKMVPWHEHIGKKTFPSSDLLALSLLNQFSETKTVEEKVEEIHEHLEVRKVKKNKKLK